MSLHDRASSRLGVLAQHVAPHRGQGGISSTPDGAPKPATAVICGGVVLDIQAESPTHKPQAGGSVPGQVRPIPGGVARNIADAASQLAPRQLSPPILVSAVGKDAVGEALMGSLRSLRLDLTHLRQVPGMRTACVVAMLDRQGEVAACVADVEGLEAHLTPAALSAALLPALGHAARCLVLEANLPETSMAMASAAAAALHVPVVLEPVSVPKAARCVPCLPHAAWVTPNVQELVAVADELCARQGLPPLPADPSACAPIEPERAMPTSAVLRHAPHAALLLQAGVQRIALTLGADGAALISRSPGSMDDVCVDVTCIPALPVQPVSLSGAGDTLVGALIAGMMAGHDDETCLALGVAAAAKTVASARNVCPTLDLGQLQAQAQELVARAVRCRMRVAMPTRLRTADFMDA